MDYSGLTGSFASFISFINCCAPLNFTAFLVLLNVTAFPITDPGLQEQFRESFFAGMGRCIPYLSAENRTVFNQALDDWFASNNN